MNAVVLFVINLPDIHQFVFTISKKSRTEAGHSIELKLTPANRSPSICFCTLLPCDLDL